MKGEIRMSQKEIERIPILEKAILGEITNKKGAKEVGISERQFRRLKSRYRKEGAKGIIHRSRGRRSNRALSQGLKDYAIQIIKKEYFDFGPTLAHEKLVENYGIKLSIETLRKEMIKNGIWKAKRKKKSKIHLMRKRRDSEGELVQIDGSPYDWFEGRGPECDLLVYIDDATGKLLWLKFVRSESRESYFRATKEYLEIHGRPLAFYADKHSVFRVNTTRNNSASTTDSNGRTQFGRAMDELDIELIAANTPQAKGRVERVNQTLQDRLVKEMRLLKISSIEEGNEYLPKFIKKFNEKFGVKAKNRINAHRPVLKEQNLDEILCIKETRIVSKNLTIQYKNKTYQIDIKQGYEYTMRKAKVVVIEKMNGEIKLKYRGREIDYSVIKINKSTREYDTKMINKKVDKLKKKKGFQLQFKLLGGTFLIWRKPGHF